MARDRIFRFKQFAVSNTMSAMKVGTDGVLLGAWCTVKNRKRVLDVGTGTGLIALMIAQRCEATVDAVEIDVDAFHEARLNFDNSPWCDRLNAINVDFLEFAQSTEKKYDVIVSNPPFFIDSLTSPNDKRTIARHAGNLNYYTLMDGVAKILLGTGDLFLITPVDVAGTVQYAAEEYGMYVIQKVEVFPTPQSEAKRILWHISPTKSNFQLSSLIIETARHQYTNDYVCLTKDFYLKM